jgi:diguanylate cyclase (GGDEF)-like protein
VAGADDISLVPLGGLSVEAGPDTGLVVAVGERPLTVGRETGCEVRLTDTSCSRRHIRVLPGPAGGVVLEDLGSANGTFVNGLRASNVELRPGDLIGIGETAIRFLSEAELVGALRQRTMRVTERDPLTQACTRRLFDMRLRTEITLAARSGGVISLALVAFDGMEEIVKRHGAAAGERVLQAAGLALGGYLGENGLLGRFDEASFAALVIDPSPNTAYLAAERMCAGIEGMSVEIGGQAVTVTASIGLASEKGRRDLTPDGVINRAKAQLESAREAGGNCVARWVHPSAREPVPAVSGDLRGTVVGSQRKP